MSSRPCIPISHHIDRFGDALRQARSREAGPVQIEAIVRAGARSVAACAVRCGLVGLDAMIASAGRRVAASLRTARATAPAALLCLTFGTIPARADEPNPALMLLKLAEDAHGMLTVPMHVDTTGLPAVVVVHDGRDRSPRSHLYVDTLLALGITVLEIEPFRHVTSGAVAPPHVGDIQAATAVTDAADALALAEGIDPRAIGVLGFGAGARAVLLAGSGASGRSPLTARVLLHPGCKTLQRSSFDRILASPAPESLPGERASAGGASPFSDRVWQVQVLLVHDGRDPGNTEPACAALASDLATVAEIRHVVIPGAGDGVDAVGPGAAAISADTVSAFLAKALSAWPVRSAAR